MQFRVGLKHAGLPILIAGVFLASTPVTRAAPFEAAFDTGHQAQQVPMSPAPVALTGSESFDDDPFGSGVAAAIAAAGPGLANGVATAVMSTEPDELTGRTGWAVSAAATSTVDGIIISGPPGTPAGAIVEYSVNLLVTSDMQASHSGPARPYSTADGRVRFGTASSLVLSAA
jgi:hypothetical protein